MSSASAVPLLVAVWMSAPGLDPATPGTAAAVEPARQGEPRTSAIDGMALVHVPAGPFLMGSSEAELDGLLADCPACERGWFSSETPQHEVELDGYWIDRTEVTNAMFARFAAAVGYRTEGERLGSGIVFSLATKDWKLVEGASWRHPQGPRSDIEGLGDHPVVQVTQNDAIAYCEWAGRRLPTEAEWEKAARGIDGRRYPWGNDPPTGDRVNFADGRLAVWGGNAGVDDGYVFTAPVGSFPRGASPYGALDMAGNVSERVADRWGPTVPSSGGRDPRGPSTGENVIMRGGSWSRASRFLRAAARVRYWRLNRSAGLGFRCAVSEDALARAGDADEHLVFGSALPPAPAPGLAPELAAFLGRWEGYDEGPPVRRDLKVVVSIQEIGPREGKALVWMGTNLQFPSVIQEVPLHVGGGAAPRVDLEVTLDGIPSTLTLVHDGERDQLRSAPLGRHRLVLGRSRSFTVQGDYVRYLARKRIQVKPFTGESRWLRYGVGYMVYLPEGYEGSPEKRWPLLLFLHGAGDRGDDPLVLAKASPFMMIREKGPLPFVIVAPQLRRSGHLWQFPEGFLDAVLETALAEYRIDPGRIYLTGLSMGGEGTYRFALHRPGVFAAIAPLCGYLADPPARETLEKVRDLPVWAIHGAEDTVVSLNSGGKPVDALRDAGNRNVRFTVLEGHDHDVWTDTYSDPRFYEWLLEQRRP